MLPTQPRFIINQFVPLDNGKTDKLPINPKTLRPHNAQDPSIQMTYETASEFLGLLDDSFSLGFVFMPQDKYFFIDIDNCLLPTGQWSPLSIDICSRFPGAYIEISRSGKGLHIIGTYEGQEPDHTCRNTALGLELYTSGRFVALTRTQAQGNAQANHTHALNAFQQYYGLLKSPGNVDAPGWSYESCAGCNPPDDNQTLLQTILNARRSASQVFADEQYHATFKDLFENNEQVLARFYPSSSGDVYDRSRADSSLAYRLHYWLGGNCERVRQIMELSKLKRDKWNREDYLLRTILGARSKQVSFASHRQGNINPESTINQQLLSKFSYPEISSNSKVLDTSENLRYMLKAFDISVRWNEMARIREIIIPGRDFLREDEQNATLRILEDMALLNEMPITRIDKNLDTLAQEDVYHPIVEGLKQNPWDGELRFDRFAATLHTHNDALSYRLLKRWMLSAIAAAHSVKGFASQGVLVLAGAQSIGKTRFFQSLDPFRCNAVKEGAILDPNNKDNIIMLASHWLVELGELDGTFRKSDMARLKSHLTNTIDKVRLPYARKDTYLARKTIYGASVNDHNFLTDDTGNRRWWTVPVLQIDLMHDIDIIQVWAEVYKMWKEGQQTWLDNQEFGELNKNNENHEQIDPFEEKLSTYFDFKDGWQEGDTVLMSASDVLSYIGYTNINKSQATHMGRLLIKWTGSKSYERRRRYALLKRSNV